MDLSVIFAGIAAGVALAALIKSHFDSDARQKWEADQTTRRENFEKRLNNAQHLWEVEQENKRTQERQEDLEREADRNTPKLIVSVEHGFRKFNDQTTSTINISVQNTGQVPVSVDMLMFHEIHGIYFQTHYESTLSYYNWATASQSKVPFPLMLYPTEGHNVSWPKSTLFDNLRENRLGEFTMEAIARDGTDKLYRSGVFTVSLSHDGDVITIPRPGEAS